MKSIFKALPVLMIAAMPFSSVSANSEACEYILRDLNGDNSKGYTEANYQTCIAQFGKSKKIKTYEEYKADLEKWEKEVEEALAKKKDKLEEEASKVVRVEFKKEDLMSHPDNFLKMPYVASFVTYKNGKAEKEEVDKDLICKQLGFETSLSHSASRIFDDGRKADRDNAPKAVRVYEKGFFGKKEKADVFDLKDFNSRDHGLAFNVLESIKCERKRKKGEEVSEFEIDMDELKRIIEQEMKAPELDEDVALALNISRRASKQVGEDKEDIAREESDDRYRDNFDSDSLMKYGRSNVK
tara:strand:+ start:120187 stop:121080 length:894 start_codon:yes stop_codon:yes gene_type:complete